MTIDVTQEDIDNGKRCISWKCPIARALQRAFNDGRGMADLCNVFVGGKWYKTPHIAKRFIKAFDSEQPVAPFSFELEV